MTRFFDIVFSLIGLIILSPILLIISVWVVLDSKGPVLYKQQRVGKDGKLFRLLKFRSMYTGADKKRSITIGKDDRITRAGLFLRRFKLDELPQLINVLKGEMSLVGPRPELKKYVDMYTDDQKLVLQRRPGITDYASIYYRNENELLGKAPDPETLYIREIMPHKIELNKRYIQSPSVKNYFSVLFKTFFWIGR